MQGRLLCSVLEMSPQWGHRDLIFPEKGRDVEGRIEGKRKERKKEVDKEGKRKRKGGGRGKERKEQKGKGKKKWPNQLSSLVGKCRALLAFG